MPPASRALLAMTATGLLPESWSSEYGSRRDQTQGGTMGKRRTREQIERLLREADRDLGKGLTIGDFCRKAGISQNTYYRWRLRFNPVQVDEGRRVRSLETEVERLKLLVAELLLDKKILKDVAKKSMALSIRSIADFG